MKHAVKCLSYIQSIQNRFEPVGDRFSCMNYGSTLVLQFVGVLVVQDEVDVENRSHFYNLWHVHKLFTLSKTKRFDQEDINNECQSSLPGKNTKTSAKNTTINACKDNTCIRVVVSLFVNFGHLITLCRR